MLFKSADSISQVKHITPDQTKDTLYALYDYHDVRVYIPKNTFSVYEIPVSWSSTIDQQLQLLFAATSNVLQLYSQTETVTEALGFAPTLEVLLLVAELVHAAGHYYVDVAKEQPAYQQPSAGRFAAGNRVLRTCISQQDLWAAKEAHCCPHINRHEHSMHST